MDYSDLNPIKKNLDKIPPILYKYREFDKKGYSLNMAFSGEVYFASGKDFNDPFECYFIPKSKIVDLNDEELEVYLKSKAINHYPSASDIEISELIKSGKESRDKLKSGDLSIMEPVMEVQYNNFGIFALTDNPYSIPMWAYYSDSFSGFCIGFDIEVIGEHQELLNNKNLALILNKIKYQEDIIHYNIDTNPKGFSKNEREETEKLYFTKSSHWNHESEYRLILSDIVSKTYSFGSNSVSEIIIGLKAKEENVENLLSGLQQINSKIKVYRLVRSQTKYELGREEITY